MVAPLLALALAVAPANPLHREITVSGDAELKFAPNQVITSFVISTTERDANAAKRNNDEKVRRLLLALQSAGVEPAHLQTSGASVTPSYRGNEVVGHIATKSVSVCITNMARVDEALTAALRAGATQNGAIQ